MPALGALVAQPLFLLVDAAVVGTLGTLPLAGLGAASTLVSLVLGLCIFLAYATTSSVARRVGEGRMDAAVSEGVEGMALGLGLGVVVALLTWLLAEPLVVALGAPPDVVPYAVTTCTWSRSASRPRSWPWPASACCAGCRTPARRC